MFMQYNVSIIYSMYINPSNGFVWLIETFVNEDNILINGV